MATARRTPAAHLDASYAFLTTSANLMSLHQLSARVHALPALQAGEMGGSVAG